MRLGHPYEVARAEIVSDLDLMLDRPLRRLAALARPQCFFFGCQLHLRAHTHKTAMIRVETRETCICAAIAERDLVAPAIWINPVHGSVEMVQYSMEDRSQDDGGVRAPASTLLLEPMRAYSIVPMIKTPKS